MMDINPRKIGLTAETFSETSTADISETKTVAESWLEGIFYEKPATTPLTVTLSLPNGSEIRAIDITAPDALADGYRSLGWPIVEGSTLTVTTTGAVSGDKVVTPIFRPMRG